jgi:hypothetical protein
LPLGLGFLGLPGCTLYTDLTYQWPVFTDAFGEATISFGGKLPQSGLSGKAFRTQWVTVDLSAPTPELGLSRQMTLTAP